MFDVSREMGSSVALYSRKVLIQTKATDILPKWLRFLRGVDPPQRLHLLLVALLVNVAETYIFLYDLIDEGNLFSSVLS